MLNHLLGLDHLNLFADGTYLSFRYALPAWAWLLIVLGAGGFSAWTYSRLLGAKWARTLLAGVRTLALLLVAVLLAGPQLQQDHEVVEPDCVLVLVDRSASMMVRDVRQAGGGGSADEGGPSSAASDAAMGAGFETSGGSGGGVTRDAAVRAALAELEKQPDNPLRSSDDRQVLWFGFDAQAYALSENSGGTSGGASGGGNPRMSEDAHPRRGENTATSGQQLPGVPGLPELPGAEGQATLLRSALDEALYRVGGRPVSGVVLITDGRSPQATGPEYEAMLEQRRVAVFATPVGSEKLPADLLVENVDAPRRAFVKDRVPVQVKAAARGDVSPDQPVTVRLIEGAEGEGKTVDVYHTTAGELGKKPITLTAVREQPGDATWRVEVSMAPGSGDGTASGGGGSADDGGPSSAALSGATSGALGGGRARLLNDLDKAQMVVLQIAFYGLGVGILLGAYWADHAWGRWWGWDPKETWALITWIIYLIAIHLRLSAGVKNRGLTTAWLSVIGFGVMLWCYWGVNMLLAGLHSYA